MASGLSQLQQPSCCQTCQFSSVVVPPAWPYAQAFIGHLQEVCAALSSNHGATPPPTTTLRYVRITAHAHSMPKLSLQDIPDSRPTAPRMLAAQTTSYRNMLRTPPFTPQGPHRAPRNLHTPLFPVTHSLQQGPALHCCSQHEGCIRTTPRLQLPTHTTARHTHKAHVHPLHTKSCHNARHLAAALPAPHIPCSTHPLHPSQPPTWRHGPTPHICLPHQGRTRTRKRP